jgi:aminopeptidase N
MKSLRKVTKKYSQNYWQGGEKLSRSSRRWLQGRLGPVGCAALSFFLLLLLACLPSVGQTALRPPSTMPEYRLEVSFDLPRGKIRGQVVIQAPPGKKLVIDPGDLNLIKVEERGRRIAISRGQGGIPLVLFPQGPVHLTYEGTLKNSGDNRIDERGLSLQGMWYPQVEGFCRFKLTATLPAGFVAISEADRIIQEEKAGQAIFQFDFPYPLHDSDGISLVASNRFVTSHTTYRGIELWTYLLPEEAPLAAGYLERTKILLEKYENLFGPFPYRRFAIVESFLKPALALPTYVLLNRDKLREENPDNSPLDHELVHQWFGCAVSPDFERGNWSEGLATYFSSHLQHEERSEGWLYRRTLLADFQSRIKQHREYPLRNFSECCGKFSRAIGYGKGAMVFHMLRQEVGDQAFATGLREFFQTNRFAVASWKDIQQSFEQIARRSLSGFFRQWLDEVGQPKIAIKMVDIKNINGGCNVTIVLRQDGRPKRLALPVSFRGSDGEVSFRAELDQGEKIFSYLLNFSPQEVVIDEEYQVFRALLPVEFPSSLALSPYIGNVSRTYAEIPKGIRHLFPDRDFKAAMK